MLILINVFPIKMVARRFLGFSIKPSIQRDLKLDSTVRSSVCDCVREKNAFSVLDIIADIIINMTRMIKKNNKVNQSLAAKLLIIPVDKATYWGGSSKILLSKID